MELTATSANSLRWLLRRLVGLLLLAASLAPLGFDAPYEFPFDPASCKHNPQGNLYVALGRYVFGMPYAEEGNFVYNRLRAGEVGLRPPDPIISCFLKA
jgi:hypothetical protein